MLTFILMMAKTNIYHNTTTNYSTYIKYHMPCIKDSKNNPYDST
jgi:hypothetical protein